MSSWRKKLAEILEDPRPVNYRYDELANILRRLGFEEGGRGSSHRVWRFSARDGNVHRVLLVDHGHGPLKRVYVEKMCATIRLAGLDRPLGGESSESDEQ